MECPHIPVISYGEFGRRLRSKIAGRRVPIAGSLELTFRCNLRCVHCYLRDAWPGGPDKDELNRAEVCDLLDQLVDEGCLWLLLTGGEPLVRSDFLDIYTHAKQRGLLVTLFTNGTLITEQIADYLQEWRPFVVEITLYGHSRETYEAVTGVPGSYERCKRGIELLVERDIPLRLKTMALTLNKHEIQAMKEYATELGLGFRFDPMVNAGLNGSPNPASFRLTPEEVVQFDLADADRRRDFERFCEKYVRQPTEHKHIYVCGAGLSYFHIDPHGLLSLCIMSRSRSYDLRRGSFRAGWEEFLPQVRYQTASDEYQCNRCELLALCGQCPGWAYLEHGDEEARVEFLCRVAHLRAEAFSHNDARAYGDAAVTSPSSAPPQGLFVMADQQS